MTAVDFNPYSHALQANPYPVYEELRENHPVWRNPMLEFWGITLHEDVFAALKEWDPSSLPIAFGHGA